MNKLSLFITLALTTAAGIAFASTCYNDNNRDSSSPPVVANDPRRLALQCATQLNPASQYGYWHCPNTVHCDNLSTAGWWYGSSAQVDGSYLVTDGVNQVLRATKHGGRSDILDVNFWNGAWVGTCTAYQPPMVCGPFGGCTMPPMVALVCN